MVGAAIVSYTNLSENIKDNTVCVSHLMWMGDYMWCCRPVYADPDVVEAFEVVIHSYECDMEKEDLPKTINRNMVYSSL